MHTNSTVLAIQAQTRNVFVSTKFPERLSVLVLPAFVAATAVLEVVDSALLLHSFLAGAGMFEAPDPPPLRSWTATTIPTEFPPRFSGTTVFKGTGHNISQLISFIASKYRA